MFFVDPPRVVERNPVGPIVISATVGTRAGGGQRDGEPEESAGSGKSRAQLGNDSPPGGPERSEFFSNNG